MFRRIRTTKRFCHIQSRQLENGGKATGVFNDDGYLKEGTLLSPDGTKRIGAFHEGKLKQGRVHLADGRTYIGDFSDGVIKYGRLEEDGSCYEGEFNEKWQRHGEGVETHPDGAVHKGRFENDYLVEGEVMMPETEGRGAIHFDGFLTEGKFVNGTLSFGGMTYMGELKNNNPHGQGRLTMPDGSVREGVFHQGLLNGKGQIILRNGTVLTGVFSQGLLPNGEIKWANADFYEGELDDKHRPSGAGTMYKADTGHWWAGQWKAGTFSGGQVTDSEGVPVDYRQESPQAGALSM
eukprot:TRINITY_DN25217_c0_g1_i1.p1 TRINITY_DN25217_c0_g1~~TRINITY_DN25217_c0_g1_i1.p1  ORF type:complete len:293 (+),score=74.58 TRINITY_DN25217_c0_g1_i1:73-951(+)